jgi:hypothetical protein
MRWRLIACISLGVNLVLAAAWLHSRSVQALNAELADNSATDGTNQTRTNVVLRRLSFSWREVESTDYPTYIANLRSIGCPEETIRDIIIADVNSMYAKKRATELLTPSQQWWRSEADPAVLQAASEKLRGWEEERLALLNKLLGISWEARDLSNLPRPTRSTLPLDGPMLGQLSPEIKQAVMDVTDQSQTRLQTYLDDMKREGKTPDPLEIAKLRKQTRDDLARVLSPGQLEEYLLRYSQNANDLRDQFGELRYFNASEDEFRAVFRSTDSLSQQIQLLVGDDANTVAQRKSLEDQREAALKNALGEKRYEEYRLLQDPVYRDAVATAEQNGNPDAARTIYEINLASLEEQAKVRASTNLTAEQKAIELKQLELDQQKANSLAAGNDLAPGQELPPLPVAPQPKKIYLLSPGDSAATIAMMYGVPLSAIRAANPNVNLARLRPGDSLNIPRSPYTPAAAQ